MGIPLYKPSIKRKDMDSVLTCLVSDQIGPSSFMDELIHSFSRSLETHNGVALREFPRALDLLADLLDLKEGDRVIISPLAPRGYGRFFEERGLIPLYADVNELKGTMEQDRVRKLAASEPRPRAIFAVHPLGFMEPLDELAETGLPLVEDVSHSLGAVTGDVPAGTRGRFVLLGMEPYHMVTAGGGCLLLSREEADGSNLEQLKENLLSETLLPDMNSSLGLVQWTQLDSFVEKRRQLALMFSRSAARGRHKPFREEEGEKAVWSGFPLYLKDSMKEIRQYARKKNIETALAFSGSCVEHMEDRTDCPVASRLSLGTLLFPLYPMMGQKNGELISRVLTTLP